MADVKAHPSSADKNAFKAEDLSPWRAFYAGIKVGNGDPLLE